MAYQIKKIYKEDKKPAKQTHSLNFHGSNYHPIGNTHTYHMCIDFPFQCLGAKSAWGGSGLFDSEAAGRKIYRKEQKLETWPRSS